MKLTKYRKFRIEHCYQCEHITGIRIFRCPLVKGKPKVSPFANVPIPDFCPLENFVEDEEDETIDIPTNAYFESPSEFLLAIKKLSNNQKERMLMDIAWKCWNKPKGLTMKLVAIQSYNTSILAP